MSAKKIKDLAVKVRTYTDRNGDKKHVWQNVGARWLGDDGNEWETLSRWFNPAGIQTEEGRDTINISVFPVKPNDGL